LNYKLINKVPEDKKNILSIAEQILYNRGIENPDLYMSLTDKNLYPYNLLDNIDDAVKVLLRHIEEENTIGIISDSDADGYCSASILFQYLSEIYDVNKILYFIHTKKQHGISYDIQIPSNVKLLFVPDAGSNDADEAKALKEKGVDIICLDHHEKSKENPYAIIINPKWCEYPNKELSGTGVVWKFLQAIDDELWENRSDKYLDIVALSIIGDGMDIREFENKRIIDKGLSNIKNKFLNALIEKQSYSISGIVNIINVQFYIIPLINGLIRNSTFEEKELMFKAFCQMDEEFDYMKRGETEPVKENIYARVARLCVNNKAKQDRIINKSIEEIIKDIEKYKWDDNKVLFVKFDDIESSYVGLTAMKLASLYSKPCILFRETNWKPGFYNGSGRNIDNSPIENLRDFVLNTDLFTMAQGHASAFGCEFEKENIREIISVTNEILKDIIYEKIYSIDFVFDEDELSSELIREFDKLKTYWGTKINESLVLIKNIHLNTADIKLVGKELDTWKYTINDEIEIIKFKCSSDDEIIQLHQKDWGGVDVIVDAIGKLSISGFNGIMTPQFNIIEYEIKK